MNSYTQLYIITLSFLFGMFFYIFAKYNLWIIKKLKPILKYIVTFIFIIDVVIIYIYIIYKINKGIFHIYFLLSIFLGFILMNKIYPKLTNRINILWKKFLKKE